MVDFSNESVLEYTIQAFSESIALKIKQLRRYVPKKKSKTNPALTGAYIEELVRGFIRDYIGSKQLLHGTYYSKQHVESNKKPMQIDGIVYEPKRGPLIIQEGDFAVLHPAFSAGVIEIKMTISNIKKFEGRLQSIHSRYLQHLPKTQVMGVVIADKNPEKTSYLELPSWTPNCYHNYHLSNLCPIFILFKETKSGDYEPHKPAIDCMIRAIFNNLVVTTNYIG